MSIALADCEIRNGVKVTYEYAGRQVRVFRRLLSSTANPYQSPQGMKLYISGKSASAIVAPLTVTYGEALEMLRASPEFYEALDALPLRTGSTTRQRPPDALQDLSDEFIEDMTEACAALDDPDIWYPGSDDVEPVSDDHIRTVIAAIQPELDRERRNPLPSTGRNEERSLPAVHLEKLPWRIQRALVERRRLRFLQWGIGVREWERDRWSLWAVPSDPEWTPRRREP